MCDVKLSAARGRFTLPSGVLQYQQDAPVKDRPQVRVFEVGSSELSVVMNAAVAPWRRRRVVSPEPLGNKTLHTTASNPARPDRTPLLVKREPKRARPLFGRQKVTSLSEEQLKQLLHRMFLIKLGSVRPDRLASILMD